MQRKVLSTKIRLSKL